MVRKPPKRERRRFDALPQLCSTEHSVDTLAVTTFDSFAVVYVGRNRFDLKAGAVYWAEKKVGWYDRKGCGEINEKPIRIYRPEKSQDFVLAEIRKRQAA